MRGATPPDNAGHLGVEAKDDDLSIQTVARRQRASLVGVLIKTPVLWTAICFVRGELLNPNIPVRTRFMRTVCHSDHARAQAMRVIARRLARKQLPVRSRSLFVGVDPSDILSRLRVAGFADGLTLPRETVQALVAACETADFYPDRMVNQPFRISAIDPRQPDESDFIYRLRNPHLREDLVSELVYDPLVVGIAREYFGMEPLLLGTRIWWSFPSGERTGDGSVPEYGFHYDIDDYKFLKLFFYLVPVDLDTGPHVIVDGTHTRKTFFEKFHRRLTDQEVAHRYPGRIRTMTGDAGTGFFEDTSCYHKGTNPKKPRLILEVEYGVSPRAS